MKRLEFLMISSLLLIIGISNAQQQVNEKEVRNAAINTLYSAYKKTHYFQSFFLPQSSQRFYAKFAND